MLNDLVELATTVVHPDHQPDISHSLAGSSQMARRRQGSKSQSVSSATELNGMPPPATPASKSGTPARKSRSRSAVSPPGSPKPLLSIIHGHEPQPQWQNTGRYIAAVALSIVSESVLQSVRSQLVGTGELAAVAKRSPTTLEAVGPLGWKITLLTLYWFGNFDAYDVASLTLLITTPTNILLGFFYSIRPSTLAATSAISIFSNTMPYLALRPLSAFHTPSQPASKSSLRNRPILTDPYTTIATSLLATAIFAVLIEISFATFLPKFMIVHFDNLRTLEPAHQGAAGLPILLASLLPAGYACMEFLFAPSTAATPFTAPEFDPATSGIVQHFYWNVWGWYTARQRMLILRAAVLGLLMIAETVVFAWGGMESVELVGALGYAGVWVLGVAVVAGALDWVGGPSD